MGNYYQWNAATAGTGGTITNQNAPSSICPKNWKLPNSDYYDASWHIVSAGKGSFTYLLQQYGVSSSLTGTSSVNSNTYNIALSPLFFVRGGYVNPSVQQFWYAGQSGAYWSSRAYSSTVSAYYLTFNSGVNPSNAGNRYLGFSLRCLVVG